MRFASIDESAEFIVRAKLSRGVIVNGATSVATRSISGEEAVFTHFLTLDFPRVQIFTLLLSPFGWISLKLQKPLTIWFGGIMWVLYRTKTCKLRVFMVVRIPRLYAFNSYPPLSAAILKSSKYGGN